MKNAKKRDFHNENLFFYCILILLARRLVKKPAQEAETLFCLQVCRKVTAPLSFFVKSSFEYNLKAYVRIVLLIC